MDARIIATSAAAGEPLRPNAANFARGGVSYVAGRWSEPDDIEFWFHWTDGTASKFCAEQLRADPWWKALPDQIARSIEAHLSNRASCGAARG